jgi:FKBP-type peptidyl-prolyl cis-trans isomerase FklB
MKHLVLIALSLGIFTASIAQPGKAKPKSSKPTPKSTASKKHNLDSISYALGQFIGDYYNGSGLNKINLEQFKKGVADYFKKGSFSIDPNKANMAVTSYVNEQYYVNPKTDINVRNTYKAGVKFMDSIRKAKGISVTPSGLAYQVLEKGTGMENPVATSKVSVYYTGKYITGEQFESNMGTGSPVTFGLNEVIPGWTEGVQLMTVGSKYRFYIPVELAYGSQGKGSIPGGAALVFDIILEKFEAGTPSDVQMAPNQNN